MRKVQKEKEAVQKAKEAVQDSEVQLPNATFCRNFLQDPSGDPSDTSTGSGAVPPDVSCNDHNVRVESSAQANGSGGPLLQPSGTSLEPKLLTF